MRRINTVLPLNSQPLFIKQLKECGTIDFGRMLFKQSETSQDGAFATICPIES